MLDFDDNAADFAEGKIEYIFNDGSVFAGNSNIKRITLPICRLAEELSFLGLLILLKE